MPEYISYIQAWMPGTWEWLVILIVALLIFGKRLPEVARNLGKSMTEFKKGLNEAKDIKDDLTKDAKNIQKDAENQIKDAGGAD